MKGAIFDLDGTLMDSMDAWAGMWKSFLYEKGLTPPERFTQDITPLGPLGTARYLQRLGLDREEHAIVEMFQARILPAYQHDILPKPGVPAYLRKLKAERVKLCVLTASPQKFVQPCLKRAGLWELFDFAWCCDDVGMKKSDPAIYPYTAKALGVPFEETVFFDDNLGALTAAHQAGVYTVGVYDESSAADRPQIERIVDRYIESFEELT